MRIAINIFLFILATSSLYADTITTIDFENTPPLATGPAVFQDAGLAETIDVPGVATITGGVVLGLAAALPGVPGVTAPNIYATASDNVVVSGGFTLPDTITIDIAPGMVATQASVPIINGLPVPASYTITAFDGSTQIDQATYLDLAAFDSITAMVTETAMTSIEIASVDTSSWDFATDTIVLTESPGGSPPVTTPEPFSASLALLGIGAIILSAMRRNPDRQRP